MKENLDNKTNNDFFFSKGNLLYFNASTDLKTTNRARIYVNHLQEATSVIFFRKIRLRFP